MAQYNFSSNPKFSQGSPLKEVSPLPKQMSDHGGDQSERDFMKQAENVNFAEMSLQKGDMSGLLSVQQNSSRLKQQQLNYFKHKNKSLI